MSDVRTTLSKFWPLVINMCYLFLFKISRKGYSKIIPVKITTYINIHLHCQCLLFCKPYLKVPCCLSDPSEHFFEPLRDWSHRCQSSDLPWGCASDHTPGVGRKYLECLFWRRGKKGRKLSTTSINMLFDLGTFPVPLVRQQCVSCAAQGVVNGEWNSRALQEC